MTGFTPDTTEVLAPDDCWQLIRGTHVARLAVSVRGEPDIFPVTVWSGDAVAAFRTVPGTKLATLVTNEHVALEWDALHEDHAWSVVLHGTARRLDTASEVAAVQDAVGPVVPLVDVPTDEWVEVTATAVTGRRFARPAG
ncbi:pyridoxamine 5'-phosphate oxidase family protein [Cellulosimicrobium arenosum]|uniref:Pyridoxamine 5'-phosphate oxidase family protein n=1 Tax=Cellulosimicrobium arenosum TaxID=2708133 RepID=A0A927G932_9MICO|nr:pyridoxamine 5'-phosphate oxidase family protein [Cellulosimicrobium arenosum]MBD8079217.1 pyridoxamine 5'-phosphate oxidase family protein [Cellulosimicrobium arenosum]